MIVLFIFCQVLLGMITGSIALALHDVPPTKKTVLLKPFIWLLGFAVGPIVIVLAFIVSIPMGIIVGITNLFNYWKNLED